VSNVASILSKMTETKAILVAAMNGEAARLVSRFRPELPICAAVPSTELAHQLNLSWGVRPLLLEKAKTMPELIEQGVEELKRQKLVSKGDEIVIVAGDPVGDDGHVQLVELKKV
jgi:pyruvate kinase